MRERTRLGEAVAAVRGLEAALAEGIELAVLAEEEGDGDLFDDCLASLRRLAAKVERLRLESLLSGEADGNDCYLGVHAGAGGTESQDWAEMLLRMYTRWAERRGFTVQEMEASPGEEAGIKSATVKVGGAYAYGWAKTESGVHRLVRISPFDSQARRHTSFARVVVSPVADDSIRIEIEDKDVRVDTYRSSGAGGQHVNKTDSAVRMTHLPTGIVVQCQNERSQHKNRATAMKVLRSRLYDHFEEQQRRERRDLEGDKRDISWGNQIRSYVFQPYTLVKDHRSKFESGNVQAVMDGAIDRFITAYLKHAAAAGRPAPAAGAGR